MERIAVVGGGGHAKAVLDALLTGGAFEVVAVVVQEAGAVEELLGVPLAAEEALPCLRVRALAMGVGSVGDISVRERLFERLRAEGFEFPAIIHPSAAVSPNAEVADGVYVGPNATVCAGARLGFGCIVNSGAVVDHDCEIGELAHIAPGAALSGGVRIGRGSHVGTGASVAQLLTIGEGSIVGVGSAVVDDVPDRVVAAGVPCRVVRQR